MLCYHTYESSSSSSRRSPPSFFCDFSFELELFYSFRLTRLKTALTSHMSVTSTQSWLVCPPGHLSCVEFWVFDWSWTSPVSSTSFCLQLLLSKYLWPLSCVNRWSSIPPKHVGFIIFYPFPVRYRAKTGQNNFQTHALTRGIVHIVFRRRWRTHSLLSLSSHKIWKPPNSKEHSIAK